MSNSGDYYAAAFTGQRHSLVKAEHFMAMDAALVAAFNKLPGLRALLEDRVTAVVATGGPTNFTVRMNPAPTAYTDGMALQVRFPVANAANPNMDILNDQGVSLGAKPIKQVDGTNLSAGHVARHARAELYYVAEGSGYWTLGAGARGAQGPAGPPDGTFSVNASGELIFTPTGGGGATNLGRVRPYFQGAYSSNTTYRFFDLVRSGAYLYVYINATSAAGQPVTNTAYWQRYSDLPVDGGMLVEFRTATSQADPGNGRMRFNHATPASVTAIYLDDQDTNGNNLAAWVDTWDDFGDDPNAQLVIRGTGGNTEALVFNLTAVAALSGYRRLTVRHVAGSALPSNGDIVSVVPLLRGNTGRDGNEGEKGSIFVAAAGVAQSGGGNAVIALTPSPAATAYSAGDTYEFVLKSDISQNASINVSGRGNKDFSFTSALRISSLKAGYVLRAVYDGTRFLLGSLAAAVFTAAAVTFTASDASFAWPYAAPKALIVIEGAGGGGAGGGPNSTVSGVKGGGGGSGGGLGGQGGASSRHGSDGVGDNGGAGVASGAGLAGSGSGGNATKVTVLGTTYTAHGGGGGATRVSTGIGGGGSIVGNPQQRTTGNLLGLYGNGLSGGGRPGGTGGAGTAPLNQSDGKNGGSGLRTTALVSGLTVGTSIAIVIGAGGAGGQKGNPASTAGTAGSNGRVVLYPLWA